MLQAIRSKTGSLIVKALAGVLILSFAAWGIEDVIGTSVSELSVATVGKQDIPPLEFEYELARETQRLRQTFGGQLSEEQLLAFGIGNGVLQRMINEQAVTLTSAKMGLRVSDDQVTRSIQGDPTFHGFDNQFSRQRFYEVMRAVGLTEASYIEQVRNDIANAQVLGSAASSASAPKKMTEILRAYRYEKRTAETLIIRASAQPDPGQPTDAQINEIYKAQVQRFTAPEYRTVSYVHLDPANLASTITVAEEDLQESYEANAASFIKAEQRTVQQIVVSDEVKIREAARLLAEGRDFVTVASEVAEMEAAAVDLGTVTIEGLLPDLAEAVFAIDEGAVTEPIKSPLGWHIMKATSVDVGIVQTLDDVREEVREIVGRERAIDALYDISIKFEDEIGGGATLEEAGNTVGFSAKVIQNVDRQGNAQSGAKAAGLPELASLLPLAFTAERGIESDLTEVGDRGFFMLRVDNVVAPALRPLDTVRAEVVDVWKASERTKLAETKAAEIVKLVNAGTDFTTLFATVPDDIEVVGPLTRGDRDAADASIIAQMYELKRNTSGIARVGSDYAVVRVTNVQAPGTDAGTPSMADLNQQLGEELGRDLAAQIVEAMREEVGVSINQRLYEAVIEPGSFDPYAFIGSAPPNMRPQSVM